MEAVSVSEEPLPPDDLRCKRTDGRDWRCKRPIVDGKSFCLSHLHRGQKQPPRNSNFINNSNSSLPASTTSNPKPKPRVRIRVKLKPQTPAKPDTTAKPDIVVKPEPVEDAGFGEGPNGLNPAPDPVQALAATGPVPDHLRCHRNDGRTWRCKKQALVGQTLCEVHFNKAKAQNQRKPRMRALKKKKEDENEGKNEGGNKKGEGEDEVEENFRCGKNYGKERRCMKRVVEGQTFCQIHLKKDNNQKKNKKGEIDVNCGNKRKKKDGSGGGGGGGVELPESLRCTRNDGKLWRCKSRVVEGQNLCEPHLKRVRVRDLVNGNKKKKTAKTKNFDNVGCNGNGNGNGNCNGNAEVVIKEEKEDGFVVEKENSKRGAVGKDVVAVGRGESNRVGTEDEEATRCKRTDGRGWRCKRRVSEGKTLCEIHYEQGRLRQMKITVPEELKIQRGEGGEKAHKSLKRKRELEILENNSDKGMKRMKAELIRVFLRREILESKKKSEKSSGEVTRDLPFGLMAIPPAPPTQFIDNNAGSLGIKIGAHCSNSLVTRRFRSKNIEPLPIGSLKVVPYPGNVGKLKSSGRKKCHWCRKCEDSCLIRCSSCKKRYFCSNCIKERSADPEEVKSRCPACNGSCDCKACCSTRSRGVGAKEVLKENCMGSKFLHLQYLINFLLPILVQINQEQSIEVEMEAKFKGQNSSDVEIRQADVGCRDQCCCNNCKSPILDFHRSCPNCSYNLCLSCCREYTQGGSLGGIFPNRTKTLFPRLKNCSEKSADLASSAPLPDSTACLRISCPPMELGGCDNSLLDLRCIFPLNWTKELEISTKETASEFDFLQNTDDSVNCSLCARISQAGNKSKELQEASRRKESNDNFLYCPSTSVDHSCLLAHFQKHWRKGQPVKVRNVLQCVSVLSWDPLAMFCGYLENGFSNGKNSKNALETASCSGSYDVQISTNDSFSGSMEEGYMHRRCETLKVKAKISSAFSCKLLEGYYSEIIHALPFQEYTNPRMGLLNIAGKLPEDFPDSKLGPHVCISYGSREEVARGDLVTKLCCNSYDVVNILVHVGDAQCSTEQLNKIKKLIKRNNSLKEKGGQASNKDLEDEDTRIHSEISVEAGEQLRVAGASCCSAAANDVSAANNLGDNKASSPAKLVNCSDTDSDASMICSRTSPSPEKSVDQIPHLDHLRSPIVTGKQPVQEPCGAQWDVFRRQDIPKLLEYIEKHVDELRFSYGLSDNIVHPIFDGSLYLDAAHKMQLKEEFEIEPWTFSQCLGEAVFIPAGCPYQIRNVKSCVNIALGFVSPENASECIKLINGIRVLPNNHKAKQVKLEVEKMTICSIDEAIKEIYRLMSEGGSR